MSSGIRIVGNLDKTWLTLAIKPPESKVSACASENCLWRDMGYEGFAAKNGGAYLSSTLERFRGMKVARTVKSDNPPSSGRMEIFLVGTERKEDKYDEKSKRAIKG